MDKRLFNKQSFFILKNLNLKISNNNIKNIILKVVEDM